MNTLAGHCLCSGLGRSDEMGHGWQLGPAISDFLCVQEDLRGRYGGLGAEDPKLGHALAHVVVVIGTAWSMQGHHKPRETG